MASFRFKQVADAASGGLDLFIGREAEKERRALDQQWAMALEDLRESRAVAREGRQTEAQAARDKLETERYVAQRKASTEQHAATQKRITEEGELNREQRDYLDRRASTDRLVQSHYARVDERREALDKALEAAYDKETKEALTAAFDKEVSQMGLDFVDRMFKQEKLGFEVKSPGDLASLYQQYAGVPGDAAEKLAIDSGFWPDLIPKGGEIPFKPNPENIGKRDIAGGKEEYFPRGQPPPETAAAASMRPTQGTPPPMQSQQAEPWSGTRAFGEEVRRRWSQIPTKGSDRLYGSSQ